MGPVNMQKGMRYKPVPLLAVYYLVSIEIVPVEQFALLEGNHRYNGCN
jgi:hypothetical protein